MAETWRLIISEPLSGAMNMAFDEAIMTSVVRGLAPPTIRFYGWSPPAISLGYFQSLKKEIDLNACHEKGIHVVRRLTGGRSVLHCDEFTYSLIAPEKHAKVAGSVLQSYLSISRGLLAGLANLGVNAEMSEGKKQNTLNSAACFDAPSWYEMVVEGKKLIGSAQTRRNNCLLQHGSVLVRLNADLLFSILKFNDEKIRERAKAIFMAKATSLENILGKNPDFDILCENFKKGFELELGLNLCQEQPSDEESNWARELSIHKYANEQWNGRK